MVDDNIEEFLKGELSESEIRNSNMSSSELDELKAIKEGIRLSKLQSKLSSLQNLESEIENNELQNHNNLFQLFSKNKAKILGIAASLAILITSITLMQNCSSDFEKLYKDNYAFYPSADGIRSHEQATDISEAMASYNSKNFVEATSKIDDIAQDNPDLLFFRGISQMKIKQYTSAINSFEQYGLICGDAKSHHPYNYYLGLCYLKLDDKNNAVQYFSFVKKDTYGYPKAQKLLVSLKK